MHAQANQYIDLTQKTNPLTQQMSSLFGSTQSGQPANFNIGTLVDGDVIQYDATQNAWTSIPAKEIGVNMALSFFLSTS